MAHHHRVPRPAGAGAGLPIVKDGGFGKYVHHRELYPVDAPIVRPNRDTLYSLSIFDLDAGPITITLPNAGQRFMSLQVMPIFQGSIRQEQQVNV